MYNILTKEELAPNIHLMKVDAPAIARKAQPGQFIMLRVNEKGERIPLTIADWDREEGSITIVFNEVGTTTHKLANLQTGDYILNFVGPLGVPAEIDKFGTVVCVVVGYGVATMVPVARALKEKDNKVVSLIRAPNKESLFGEDLLGSFSDELTIVTGDASSECLGFIIDPLKEILENRKVDRVLTIAPMCVMRLVAATTRPSGIKTIASLNPIMVDGTGMCGCCRVIIGEATKFACVDGPEFDAHEVNWEWLMARRCTYSSDMQPGIQYRCIDCAQW